MGLKVRTLRLPEECDVLLRVLERNLAGLDHRRRYEWLYHRNPAGSGLAWGIFQDLEEAPAGVASVIPVYLWIRGKRTLCGRVEDFAVEPSHRSLGPAVILQKATFQPVDAGAMALCLDTPPHSLGMTTFRRLGMEADADVYRYVRLVRTAPWLEKEYHLGRPVAAAVGVMIDSWLRLRGRRTRGIRITEHGGSFGDEFTQLDEVVGAQSPAVRCSRTARELTWLYREDPLRRYEILTARRGGELIGWAACLVGEETIDLVDWLAIEGSVAFEALVAVVTARARQTRRVRVQALVTDERRITGILKDCGFSRREHGCSIVVYAGRGRGSERRDTWALRGVDVRA
jgi:hypothetical protein